MRCLAVAMLAVVGCSGAPPAPMNDGGSVPDLAEVQQDADTLRPDMIQSVPDLLQLAADLLQPATDLARSPDLAPSCGKVGLGCCSGSCDPGLTCLYTTDLCGTSRPSTCVLLGNCGSAGLSCCDSVGNPTSGTGYCRNADYCHLGKCMVCS